MTSNQNIHKVIQIAKLLKLKVRSAKEPTTGYWFAYIGHDDGKYTSCNTCSGMGHKTERDALDDLLLMVRDVIDHGRHPDMRHEKHAFKEGWLQADLYNQAQEAEGNYSETSPEENFEYWAKSKHANSFSKYLDKKRKSK